MVIRYLLVLLLSGCAGNQNALPMPPVFSPAEDAPIFIGQPGTVAPEPEKSPHKRILPQTPESRREAGMWAGDVTARGTRDDDRRDDSPETPRIFGIPLPTDTPEIADSSRACAEDMQFAALHTKQNIDTWPRPQRACAAMRLYLLCTHDHAAQFERAGGEWAKQAKRLRELGLARRDAACTGTNMFIVNEQFATDVFNTYLRQTGRGR